MTETKTGVPFMCRRMDCMEQEYLAIPYSADELTKVFLAQCFDIGIVAACRKFNCTPAVLHRMKKLYARFLSAPCNKEAFTFFQICYNDYSIIDIFMEVFELKIQDWKQSHAIAGDGYRCCREEFLALSENNNVIKKISGSLIETTSVAGDLTRAVISLECDELRCELQHMLRMLVQQQITTYADALLSIYTLGTDISMYQSYFDAALLLFLNKGYSYGRVMQEVCRNYEI